MALGQFVHRQLFFGFVGFLLAGQGLLQGLEFF